MNLADWKSSWNIKLGGALLAIGQWTSTIGEPWVWKLGGLLNIIGALLLSGGRANGVPSIAVPAAAAKEAQIKSDTEPPFPSRG